MVSPSRETAGKPTHSIMNGAATLGALLSIVMCGVCFGAGSAVALGAGDSGAAGAAIGPVQADDGATEGPAGAAGEVTSSPGPALGWFSVPSCRNLVHARSKIATQAYGTNRRTVANIPCPPLGSD